MIRESSLVTPPPHTPSGVRRRGLAQEGRGRSITSSSWSFCWGSWRKLDCYLRIAPTRRTPGEKRQVVWAVIREKKGKHRRSFTEISPLLFLKELYAKSFHHVVVVLHCTYAKINRFPAHPQWPPVDGTKTFFFKFTKRQRQCGISAFKIQSNLIFLFFFFCYGLKGPMCKSASGIWKMHMYVLSYINSHQINNGCVFIRK